MRIKTKIILSVAAAFIIIIGSIAFYAVDYFLIEHVEVDLNAVSSPAIINDTTDQNLKISEAVITDLSYISDEKSIIITKYQQGSGKNLLVYYVADVTINNATQLLSAFAKDKFGKNIIENVSVIAERKDALFAVNGDYYGFRTDGIIIRNGVIYRDTPVRTGLAIYEDGSIRSYEESLISAQELLDDGVLNTFSFGPALIKNGKIVGGIDKIESIDTNVGNRPINGKHPRTGIGIIESNHFIFIVADGRQEGYSNGVKMSAFAEIFLDLGCTEAYNLDGGGSAEMWFMGRVINKPCNDHNDERATSDIIYIK